MSSPVSPTKVELKAQLEQFKQQYEIVLDTKATNYERLQQEMGHRMAPLLNARNGILPMLVGNQTEQVRNNWQAAVRNLASEYERAQREVAILMLGDVEASAQAARRVLEIEQQLDNKEQEFKRWSKWSDEDLIRRFESGDMDYSIFTTKSAEHARNVDRLMNAYKTIQPNLYAPTRDVIRRAAFEVQGEAVKTPLDSVHWPRHHDEAGNNRDVTLSAETAPIKDNPIAPYTTLGPGGFMSRRLAPTEETASTQALLRVPEYRDFNVASWLQATPELAIEASLLRY